MIDNPGVPMEVIREQRGRYSSRWMKVLHAAGLPLSIMFAADKLGIPKRTLVSRLRRGDTGEALRRPLQDRPWHASDELAAIKDKLSSRARTSTAFKRSQSYAHVLEQLGLPPNIPQAALQLGVSENTFKKRLNRCQEAYDASWALESLEFVRKRHDNGKCDKDELSESERKAVRAMRRLRPCVPRLLRPARAYNTAPT